MRFVVYGAGAIGGVIGGRLFQAGHDVTLIARGEHGRAVREQGLELAEPTGSATLQIPTVDNPAAADIRSGDVVLLAVKSQDTEIAVRALAIAAPADIRLVCAQNGVHNEVIALRAFAHVYAMSVLCPSTHLEPGRVIAHSSPVTGLLDLGAYPAGVDRAAEDIAAALRGATFESEARPDILRWKYRKLLMNLANAPIALCGPDDEIKPLVTMLRMEGELCLAAAGIAVATVEEDRERRGGLLDIKPVEGAERVAGSSWQSLARGAGEIETDYLNGEIVLLGRINAVPTPANELVRRLANAAATAHLPPGHTTVAEILARLSGDGAS